MGQQGAALCIRSGLQYIAQKQGADPLNTINLTGRWPQVLRGPVTPCKWKLEIVLLSGAGIKSAAACAAAIQDKAQRSWVCSSLLQGHKRQHQVLENASGRCHFRLPA